MKNVRVVIALGKLAFDQMFRNLTQWTGEKPKHAPKFTHGARYQTHNNILLLGSYHPSQQNTFTKKLTEPMFDNIFKEAHAWLDQFK